MFIFGSKAQFQQMKGVKEREKYFSIISIFNLIIWSMDLLIRNKINWIMFGENEIMNHLLCALQLAVCMISSIYFLSLAALNKVGIINKFCTGICTIQTQT